jgi:hypothetical protein
VLLSPRRPDIARGGDWTGTLIAGGLAGGLALLAIGLGWRGADLPAQLFRVELFRRDGFVLWNSQWFSGHPTLNYSVLSPVLGALTGPLVLGALCGVGSALLFDRLVRNEFGIAAQVGSFWFAVSMVTNLVVGRVTFALGVMFALAALLALQRERGRLAVVCALLCGLACPDAGLFLAIATGAVGLASRPKRVSAWSSSATALAPAFVIAAAFPSLGSEPYEWWALARDLAVCALFLAVVPRRLHALRYGAGAYALVLIVTKFVSSPLGGIVSRLNQYAAGPLLACVLWEHRRKLLIVLAVPLLFWQWFPAFDTIAFARSDLSTHREYYQPLLAYFDRHAPGFGRVEIPSTYRHWETAFVAPQVALARGWERDLDVAYNPQFYDGTLTAAGYRSWLAASGVEYVALPDTQLDDSSVIEAGIIAHGQPYLRRVWSGPHWQVWRYTGYRGLVDGPAQLVSLTADAFTLQVTGTGSVTVHVHDSPHWAVQGSGCTVTGAGGWTEIRHVRPGQIRVVQSLRGTRCDVDH